MKKKFSNVILMIVAAAFFNSVASITVYAQTATATLVGRTTDEAEAVLPGVKITLTQTATGQTRTVVSDDSGNFVFLLLPAGKYELAAEREGFQKLVRREFDLQVDQRASLDLPLKAGQITETVEIRDEASILQTESASVGTVIDQAKAFACRLTGASFSSSRCSFPARFRRRKARRFRFAAALTSAAHASRQTNFCLTARTITTRRRINTFFARRLI